MTKSKQTLKKPSQKTKTYYDQLECRDYLQAKYKYDERNVAGCKYTGEPDDAPYLDFWHWMLENHEIHNGCFITFDRSTLEENTEEDWKRGVKPDQNGSYGWVKEIYTRYLDEFADDKGNLEMYVWW